MPVTSGAPTRMASKTVAKLVQTQLHKEGRTGCLRDLPSEYIHIVIQATPHRILLHKDSLSSPHHVSVHLCVPETDRRT